MIKVTVKPDLRRFREEQKRLVAELLSRSGKVCRDGCGVYFRWMAQMAPPSIGSVDITPKLYKRPMQILPVAIARGSKTAAQDREKLREGYSWKVIVKGKPVYYKSNKRGNPPRSAERMTHIVNRGLLRWSFVGVLPNAGIAVPVAMRPLASRSKGRDLKKNENLVATARADFSNKNKIVFRFHQSVPFANGTWLSAARARAKAKYEEYMRTMLTKVRTKRGSKA